MLDISGYALVGTTKVSGLLSMSQPFGISYSPALVSSRIHVHQLIFCLDDILKTISNFQDLENAILVSRSWDCWDLITIHLETSIGSTVNLFPVRPFAERIWDRGRMITHTPNYCETYHSKEIELPSSLLF